MDGNDIKIQLDDCCFCRELVDLSNYDICEIDIWIGLNNKAGGKEWGRAYYAHIQCFSEQLHENLKEHFYLGHLILSQDNEEINS